MRKILLLMLLLILSASFAMAGGTKKVEEGYTIAMIVKNVGNPFFEAARKGGQEAADDFGDKFIFQGPETPTAEGQIALI